MTALREITREEFDLWWEEHGDFAEGVTGNSKEAYWESVQPFAGKSLDEIIAEYPRVGDWLREWGIIKETPDETTT